MKTKWINFVVELGLDELLACLSKSSFSSNQNFGFDIFSIDENRIEGSYIEKVSIVDRFTCLLYTSPSPRD